MKAEEFFNIFLEGFKVLIGSPLFFLLGVLMGLILTSISYLGIVISPSLQTNLSNSLWTAIFGIVSLSIISFFSVGLINITRKSSIRDFLEGGKKYWFSNLVILLIVVISSIGIWAVAHYGSIFIGRAFGLDLAVARVLYVLVYFGGLVGLLIFLSFPSFYLVLKNKDVTSSLKGSVNFVKANYFAVLSLLLVSYALFSLVDLIGGWFGDLIAFGLLFPYLVIIFSEFMRA